MAPLARPVADAQLGLHSAALHIPPDAEETFVASYFPALRPASRCGRRRRHPAGDRPRGARLHRRARSDNEVAVGWAWRAGLTTRRRLEPLHAFVGVTPQEEDRRGRLLGRGARRSSRRVRPRHAPGGTADRPPCSTGSSAGVRARRRRRGPAARPARARRRRRPDARRPAGPPPAAGPPRVEFVSTRRPPHRLVRPGGVGDRRRREHPARRPHRGDGANRRTCTSPASAPSSGSTRSRAGPARRARPRGAPARRGPARHASASGGPRRASCSTPRTSGACRDPQADWARRPADPRRDRPPRGAAAAGGPDGRAAPVPAVGVRVARDAPRARDRRRPRR